MKIKNRFAYLCVLFFCAFKTNPLIGLTYSPPEHKGYLYYVTKVVDHVFHQHGIAYWMDGGTLIGALRHKSLIPWDLDVDTVIKTEDFEKLISLESEFAKYGFYTHRMCHDSVVRIYKKIYINGVLWEVILEVLTAYDDHGVRRLDYTRHFNDYVNAYWLPEELVSIERVKCGPIHFDIAKGSLAYLKRYYGPDVMTKTDRGRRQKPNAVPRYRWPSIDDMSSSGPLPTLYFYENNKLPIEIGFHG